MGIIIKKIPIALTVISGDFISSLIRIAVEWNSLPDMLGVHFTGNGESP